MTDPVMVPNPFKAELKARLRDSLAEREALTVGLGKVLRSFESGGWVSPRSDEVYAMFAMMRDYLLRLDEHVVAEYELRIAGQPDEVEQTAWQTRWREHV